MDKKDIVKAGIWGVVVGDALGVPVEFMSRVELKADPVVVLLIMISNIVQEGEHIWNSNTVTA